MQKSKWANEAIESSSIEVKATPFVSAFDFDKFAAAPEGDGSAENATGQQVHHRQGSHSGNTKSKRARNRNRGRNPTIEDKSSSGNTFEQKGQSQRGSYSHANKNGHNKARGPQNGNHQTATNSKPKPQANGQPNGREKNHHGGRHPKNAKWKKQQRTSEQNDSSATNEASESTIAISSEQQKHTEIMAEPEISTGNDQEGQGFEANFRFPLVGSIPWDVYKQLVLSFQGRELTPIEWQLAVEAAEVAIKTAGQRQQVVMASRWDWADEVAAEAEEEL